MEMVKIFPPVEVLLPHADPMLLLNECTDFGDDFAATRCVIGDKCRLFRMADGRFGSWLLIELMAQTIGVFAGLKNRTQGLGPKIGFLLGTRRFETSVGFLHEGDIVDVKTNCVFFGQEGLPSQFECRAEMNGNVVATANLTVFEPEDLEIWKN